MMESVAFCIYIYISPSSCASNIKDVEQNTEQKGADAWRPVMRRQCNQEMGSVVFSLSIFRSSPLFSFFFFFTCIKPNYLDRIIYIYMYKCWISLTLSLTDDDVKKRVGNLNRPAVGKWTLDPSTSFSFSAPCVPLFLYIPSHRMTINLRGGDSIDRQFDPLRQLSMSSL